MDDGEPLGQVEGFQRAVFTQEKLLNCHCRFVTGFGLGKFCQLTFVMVIRSSRERNLLPRFHSQRIMRTTTSGNSTILVAQMLHRVLCRPRPRIPLSAYLYD